MSVSVRAYKSWITLTRVASSFTEYQPTLMLEAAGVSHAA